jgi:hypothetical protein
MKKDKKEGGPVGAGAAVLGVGKVSFGRGRAAVWFADVGIGVGG